MTGEGGMDGGATGGGATGSGEAGGAAGHGAVLRAVGLSKAYRPRGFRGEAVWALRDVSLAVPAGDRLGIVGESGSGKSTLARLLLALEEPTAGSVLFNGTPVSKHDRPLVAELRRSVQIVFQDPLGSLDPRMRIGDSIAEPLRALRIAGDHEARVAELLEAVGLPLRAARRYPHQFSGGQRQRIAIARAIAPHPRVLIADEAVSALDVSVRAQVLNLLDSLVEHFGLTLLFVSHDLGVVRHLCTRVAVLWQGRLVEDGPADEVYEQPRHAYTAGLLRAVPRLAVLAAAQRAGAAATAAPPRTEPSTPQPDEEER
ncbi:MAG TPA: ABC transporter ATP-binding protein [Acidimicrobiales bacterium]|nr:ABC transporter ATP-binding protein [Acidimicrobiales bacterium]